MSVTVIISVYVIDFDEWKTMFDAIEMRRVAAGIHVKSYRNVDEPGAAYVIGSAPSKEVFIVFITYPQRMKIQDSSTTTSQLVITFLEEG